MKIAIVSDTVYPYMKGGKEKRLFEITKRLSKNNEIHVYTMKWWKGSNIIKKDNLYLHAISPYYPLYNKEGKRSIKEAILFSLRIPKLLKEKFDILDCDQMPYFPIISSWFVSKIKGKKLIVTWHEYWGKYWFEYLGIKGVIGYLIEKIARLFSTNIICVSELTKKRLGKNVHLIPNGIDLKAIQKARPIKEKFDILFVGRLIKEKNVEILLKHAKKYKVGIIGDGPDRERLEKLAPKKFKFLGNVSNVYSYMKSSKVFVMPSKREGFGIVVIEALAAGTPVVVLDYKNSASKYLVPKEFVTNEKNLSEKIAFAMNNKVSFEKEKFNWDGIAKQIEKVYNE